MASTPMLVIDAHLRPSLANVWLGDRRPQPVPRASASHGDNGGWLRRGTCTAPDAQAMIAQGDVDPVSASIEVREATVHAVRDRIVALLATPSG